MILIAYAQAEGYLARSAFKLQELQQKHKLISPGLQMLNRLTKLHRCQRMTVACTWQAQRFWTLAVVQEPGYRLHANAWGLRTEEGWS